MTISTGFYQKDVTVVDSQKPILFARQSKMAILCIAVGIFFQAHCGNVLDRYMDTIVAEICLLPVV